MPETATNGTIRSLADGFTSYREHLHRELAEDAKPTMRHGLDTYGYDLAFWPTRRDAGIPEIPPPVVNCQRCGVGLPAGSGWWCEGCHDVASWLQQTRGYSMVQIAASGEYDPGWGEWIQDHAPWLTVPRAMEN